MKGIQRVLAHVIAASLVSFSVPFLLGSFSYFNVFIVNFIVEAIIGPIAVAMIGNKMFPGEPKNAITRLWWTFALVFLGGCSVLYRKVPNGDIGKQIFAFAWALYHIALTLENSLRTNDPRAIDTTLSAAILHAFMASAFFDYLTAYDFWNRIATLF